MNGNITSYKKYANYAVKILEGKFGYTLQNAKKVFGKNYNIFYAIYETYLEYSDMLMKYIQAKVSQDIDELQKTCYEYAKSYNLRLATELFFYENEFLKAIGATSQFVDEDSCTQFALKFMDDLIRDDLKRRLIDISYEEYCLLGINIDNAIKRLLLLTEFINKQIDIHAEFLKRIDADTFLEYNRYIENYLK